MIQTINVIRYAARQGMILRTDLSRQALDAIPRAQFTDTETARWGAVMWDGSGDPPVGARSHWVHDQDAIGRATQEAFAHNRCVYFLLRDKKLQFYQPYVAYERGRIPLETDPQDPNYWKTHADAHIAHEVEQAVDRQVLDLAWEQALVLHEQAGIAVGITTKESHL